VTAQTPQRDSSAASLRDTAIAFRESDRLGLRAAGHPYGDDSVALFGGADPITHDRSCRTLADSRMVRDARLWAICDTRDTLGASPAFVRPRVRGDAGGRVAAYVRKQASRTTAGDDRFSGIAVVPPGRV
jgi:hypothetical protein